MNNLKTRIRYQDENFSLEIFMYETTAEPEPEPLKLHKPRQLGPVFPKIPTESLKLHKPRHTQSRRDN